MRTHRTELSEPDNLTRGMSWVLEGPQSGKFKESENGSVGTEGCPGGVGIGDPKSPEMESPSPREPGAWTREPQDRQSEKGFEHLGWKKVCPVSSYPR